MSKTLGMAGLIVCGVLGLGSTFAHAGPCTADIAQFETAIRQSASNPLAGLTARQSVSAQLNRQPTVTSIRRENERLKLQFAAIMARAKRYSNGYDQAGPAPLGARALDGNGSYAMSRDDDYRAQRYRSYDPASGTYTGYDGRRHSCR